MPSANSEARVIQSLIRAFPAGLRQPQLVTGIGDDCAIVRVAPGRLWAISTDAFHEGVHFLPRIHAPADVGYKALARAVSDLAAVGARPRYFLMNIALGRSSNAVWLGKFSRGMARAAREFGIVLIGGDTTRSASGGFSANLTVIGELTGYQPILRRGAQPGDVLFLSGIAGAAQLGLELARRGHRSAKSRRVMARHLRPLPRLALGAWLAQKKLATAMIDTSDGISTDVGNLCAASGVGAVLVRDRLPIVQIPAALQALRLNPYELALHGGDDYELLFSVSFRNAGKIPAHFKGVPLTRIGMVTAEKRIVLLEPRTSHRLKRGGWDPFR